MTTMHVVPCLYNSFSFTPENINETIVFYDVYAFKEKVIPVYATLQPEPGLSRSRSQSRRRRRRRPSHRIQNRRQIQSRPRHRRHRNVTASSRHPFIRT